MAARAGWTPLAVRVFYVVVIFVAVFRVCKCQANVASGANTTSTATAHGSCTLSTDPKVRETLQEYLTRGVTLVYMTLHLEGEGEHSESDTFSRLERELGLFQPWSWKRSTSRQGRSLLMLSDNYDVFSLSLLTIRVKYLDVTLASSPPGCLANVTSEKIYEEVRSLLLADFKQGAANESAKDGSLSPDEHVCFRQIRGDDDGVAEFVYVCCHSDMEAVGPDEAVCETVRRGTWIWVLLAAILIIKVMVVLFSPNLLPQAVYRLKYATLNYVYHLPDDKTVTLRMLKTTTPVVYGNEDRVVKLSKLSGMPKLRETVNQWQLDRTYEITVRHAQMAVKARKLLSENRIPVGLMKILYNNLFLCRLRHLSPMKDCCGTNMLGMLNPGLNLPTWFKCARLFARVLLLVLLVMPWVIRLLVFYEYEKPVTDAKRTACQRAGLDMPFTGSLTLFLTPLHVLFVLCYVILCLDSFAYGVLSNAVRQKLKLVVVRCLRDMRERSKMSVCDWVTRLLLLPCTYCGVLGLLVSPFYLALVLPLLVPVLAFYFFPAINLSLRLIVHVFIFICPSRVARVFKRLWTMLFSRVHRHMDIDTLTRAESFEKKSSFGRLELLFQILVVLVCLISFWSVTFLVMELLSFLVEVAVYTFIGVIVTSDVTSQYISIIFFLLLYGNSCFAAVHKKYLVYHKALHKQLLTMMRADIDAIARTEEMDQENTGLRVQGDMAPPSRKAPFQLKVKGGRLVWATSSILLFLDSKDTPYTTERFFQETVDLNYCGCPGKLYVNVLNALFSFVKIIVFLSFVLVVVMAFGSAYEVSSSNQLMATVAGGFIPFVFTRFFGKSGQGAAVDPDSVQFKTQFHTAINAYEQTWPIYDIEDGKDEKKKNKRFGGGDGGDESSGPTTPPPGSSHFSGVPTSSPSSIVASEGVESVDWEDTSFDVIFDVSGRSARGLNLMSDLAKREEGSQTMLNQSGKQNGDREREESRGKPTSARQHRPADSSLSETDELIDV